MFNVNVERNIDMPSDEVWEVVNDFGGYYKFNPYIEYSPISNGVNEGLGAERELKFYDGGVVRQKIIDHEPGRMILMGFTESTWPIKRGWVRINLEPTGAESCRLNYHLHFVPALGPLGALLGLYFKTVFQSQYNVILRSVEHFARTGEKIRPSP